MAQKVHIVLEDDLDGSDATHPAAGLEAEQPRQQHGGELCDRLVIADHGVIELICAHGLDETQFIHVFLEIREAIGDPLTALFNLMKRELSTQ